ncbi:MAG: phage late control D family protein, partial [Oscillibacter sp.]|nr:phage late control D family protein [Oscillibacter sp.]
VELNANGAAGGCTFTVEGEYDFESQDWVNSVESSLEVGAKLEITGGYVKQEEIFYGYVDDYSMQFPEGEPPRIQVNGLDALGFLMCFQEPIYAGQNKPKQVVEEILNKATSAGYAKSITVDSLDGFETPVIKKGVDDWKFLNTLAQRYGVTLTVIDGEIVFKNLTSNTSPVVTLSMDKSLFSFERKLSMAHQVGKVEIWGRDKNEGFLKGVANECSIGGEGKTAMELAPKFKKAGIREYSEFAKTQEECDKMAQGRLDSIAMNLVSGRGACVGLPELIPGRYVKIENGDKRLNGTYFVTKVRHRFSPDGFITEFEVKGARA